MFFFSFFLEKRPQILIISKLNDDFFEDGFEVLHISVGKKIKILKNHSNFLNFSAETPGRF